MAKFKNKYRIETNRRRFWEYDRESIYFLTIVTQYRVLNLGKIVNGKIILSDFGEIVNTELQNSFEIRKELVCHTQIIMPNHIHLLVEIIPVSHVSHHIEVPQLDSLLSVKTHGRASHASDSASSAIDDASYAIEGASHTSNNVPQNDSKKSEIPDLSTLKSIQRNRPIRLPKSISSFIAGFKSRVNTKIDDYIDEHQLAIPKYNKYNHFFLPNYHDHIVRNDDEYFKIKRYIENNPKKWKEDSLAK